MNHRDPHHLFTFGTILAVGVFTLIALDGVTLPEAAGLQPVGPVETPNPAGTPMPVDPGYGDLDPVPPDAPICNALCLQDTNCVGTNVLCPTCDDFGPSVTCSDTTQKIYNPGGAAIMYANSGGPGCIEYRAVDAGNVICFQTQSCFEGPWVSFTFCSNQIACVGTAPAPSFCQTCVPGGTPANSIVTNEQCVHDPVQCCCGPPNPNCPQ